MSTTAIIGKNQFESRQKLNQLRADFTETYGTDSVSSISGGEVGFPEVLARVSSQGLFASDTMVVLTDVAENKTLMTDLAERLGDIPNSSQLVVFAPGLDRRSVLFKALNKSAEVFDSSELDERDLARWASERFKQLGGELSLGDAVYLVQRTGTDQWAVNNELEKLINVNKKLTRAVISEHVDEGFSDTIFNLLDKAFGKQQEAALETYRELIRNKVEAHYILSMIVWQLQNIAIAVHAGGRSSDEIARDHKMSPFVAQKSLGLAGKTSKSELKQVINAATELDIASKTKAAYDVEAAVDVLIAKISTTS